MKPDQDDAKPAQPGILRQKTSPEKIARAKQLRQEMTPAERALWERLRANRVGGFHFRRQQIIQGYIVDFYCHRARLVVEVDGDIHREQVEYDLERDRVLSESGFRVLRIQNSSIVSNLEEVITMIQNACNSFSPALPGEPSL